MTSKVFLSTEYTCNLMLRNHNMLPDVISKNVYPPRSHFHEVLPSRNVFSISKVVNENCSQITIVTAFGSLSLLRWNLSSKIWKYQHFVFCKFHYFIFWLFSYFFLASFFSLHCNFLFSLLFLLLFIGYLKVSNGPLLLTVLGFDFFSHAC